MPRWPRPPRAGRERRVESFPRPAAGAREGRLNVEELGRAPRCDVAEDVAAQGEEGADGKDGDDHSALRRQRCHRKGVSASKVPLRCRSRSPKNAGGRDVEDHLTCRRDIYRERIENCH